MDLASAGPVVLDALTKACSQSADVLKPAEQQLKEWEIQSGFYSILASIFCNHSIDVNVRWLAVLYFKNGVDRYWRRTAPNAIPEDEKDSLRSVLLSNFNEPVPQVATQLAVLVAKVARLDCLRSWPQLLPTLLHTVRCSEILLRDRALLTMHHVIKMMASKRLAGDRRLFEELTGEVFSFGLSLWDGHQGAFLQQASLHEDIMSATIGRAILTLKILRKLIVFGFRDPQMDSDAVTFLKLTFDRMKDMLACRQSLWGNHQMLEKCEKNILLLTKVLLDVLESHPSCYVQFIQPTLEFVVQYSFTETGVGLLFERFTVHGFNLMKDILYCHMYRPAKTIEETTNPVTLEAHQVKMGFFTFNMLSEILRRLISQYLPLSSDYLTSWDTDPKGFGRL